jgi:hypothetical protein
MVMSDKATAAVKTTETKKKPSISQSEKTERPEGTHSPLDRILFLQRAIGNQAVQRLFKSGVIQAKRKISEPNDLYEQEADPVVDRIMGMPDPRIQPNPT